MKKSFFMAILVLGTSSIAGSASAKTSQEFLTDFQKFVNFVVGDDTKLSPELKLRADSIYNEYQLEYDKVYKAKMTSGQKEKYNQSRGQYTKYQLGEKAGKVTNKVDSVSTGIYDKVEDKVSEGVSFLKGLFK